MKVSTYNRYYCHRMLSCGTADSKHRRVDVAYQNANNLCKYAKRLRDVYHYSIQTTIN